MSRRAGGGCEKVKVTLTSPLHVGQELVVKQLVNTTTPRRLSRLAVSLDPASFDNRLFKADKEHSSCLPELLNAPPNRGKQRT